VLALVLDANDPLPVLSKNSENAAEETHECYTLQYPEALVMGSLSIVSYDMAF